MPDENAAAVKRSSLRTFAARLIAREARGRQPGGSETPEAFNICEQLRAPLATLMGSTGYHALLSRALTVARRDDPWLRTVNEDGGFTMPAAS